MSANKQYVCFVQAFLFGILRIILIAITVPLSVLINQRFLAINSVSEMQKPSAPRVITPQQDRFIDVNVFGIVSLQLHRLDAREKEQ
jgi:hypothetical protein